MRIRRRVAKGVLAKITQKKRRTVILVVLFVEEVLSRTKKKCLLRTKMVKRGHCTWLGGTVNKSWHTFSLRQTDTFQ